MVTRIEIIPIVEDARAKVRKGQLEGMGLTGKIDDVHLVDVYTVDAALRKEELQQKGFSETDLQIK